MTNSCGSNNTGETERQVKFYLMVLYFYSKTFFLTENFLKKNKNVYLKQDFFVLF